MGTTFVSVDGVHGFWMSDGVLELWLRLLSLHVEDPVQSGGEATRIRDQWLLASRGYFTGSVPHALGEAVASEVGKKLVVSSVRSLLCALTAAPPRMSADTLNLLGFSGCWTEDFETGRLIQVGNAFLDLIDGKVTGTAHKTDFMPGCT